MDGAADSTEASQMPETQHPISDNALDYAVASTPAPLDDATRERLDSVLQSELGVPTLLTRLKQSVASTKDFATFLKKRSQLEEEHAQGLKKLSRSAHESAGRPESRQGTYQQSYVEVARIHERMADHGLHFASALHHMSDELHELASNMERGRKQWKQTGLNAEKKVQDAEAAMEKAKAKYDSLAEQYDRARTGDRATGKFGLKGPKSAAQQEEDLLRKLQGADSDYSSRVHAAQSLRQELESTLRPQTVRALQDLIAECDSGLTMQLQQFATVQERLLLGNGLCVSPLKGESSNEPRSLREVAQQVNNERDTHEYIQSFAGRVGPRPPEIKYERHPTLNPQSSSAPPPSLPNISLQPASAQSMNPPALDRSDGETSPGYGHGGPVQTTASRAPNQYPPQPSPQFSKGSSLPPLRPVFGQSLEELFARDGTAVPMIVYQCLQAVDLFGLEVEGIYRLSGTSTHIQIMKAMFDNDSSQVDFRNPESFYHDVNSVAGLLKQFFRELPDPLLTSERYTDLINSARLEDDIQRRDSLHAIINSLPDPNYATLRALAIHLHRVQERSSVNRMNAGNLAICFGPTLMGPATGTGPNIADAGWQARVIDTILQNTFQIFEDD